MGFLTLDSVSFTYNGKTIPAVDNVSLDFSAGESAAVLGLNGSGKSTLAKLMMKLLKPQSGDIILKGKNIKDYTLPEIGREIGFLLQNPGLMMFNVSVYNEVAFGLKWRGKDQKEIEEICKSYLTYFNIWDHKNELPFNLSQGQKQLVALSGILALKPGCLILDEPTKNIDGQRKGRLKQLLGDIRSKGTAIIIISHDYNFVEDLCERKIYMEKGRIISDGH